MFMLCSTARIWPNRDIVSSRCHVAGLSPSLLTAPPPMARTSARKAGVLDRGARLPVRDGLSAGGESHERTRLGIEIPELAKNQVFRGFGVIPPSPNAVSLENRRGKMTSLRGRPVGLSGLKLSV